MDVTAFYSVVAATCFTLVGLWWNVIESHKDWFRDDSSRSLIGGIYASFLIPAIMSLGAQVSGTSQIIWQFTFVVAAAVGARSVARLLPVTRAQPVQGFFRKNYWVALVLYGLVILFGIAPGLATALTRLQPLQVEGMLLVLLVIIAHGLVWEFMTEAQTQSN